jgi:hypothetical protein
MTQIQQAYIDRPGHSNLYIKFVTPDGGDTINGFICLAILMSLVKVSNLGVESLLPFGAWLFPGCKNTPMLYNLGVTRISSKLEILH